MAVPVDEIEEILYRETSIIAEEDVQLLMGAFHDFVKNKRRKKANGVVIEIEGGVLQTCEVELECDQCGALVYDTKGYKLIDKDI